MTKIPVKKELKTLTSIRKSRNLIKAMISWRKKCGISIREIALAMNIYPCQDKAYNLDEALMGSIKEQRFKDFWFSDKNKIFKIDQDIFIF